MKSEPSAPARAFKIAGVTINVKNVWGKPLGFVLAFVISATISQAEEAEKLAESVFSEMEKR